MNRTNCLIIFASITLTVFLIAIATTTTIKTSAFEDSSYHPQLTEYNSEFYKQHFDNYESGYYEDRYGKSYYIE